MRPKDISDVMGTMRKQALDGAATGIWIVDSIALDRRPPSLVKGRLVVRRILGLGFDRLHEKGAGIFSASEQHGTMTLDVGVQMAIEMEVARFV